MKCSMLETTQSGKGKITVKQDQFYALLPCAKSRDKVQVLNSEAYHINKPALVEVTRMRAESIFLWQHQLLKI